MTKRYEFYIVLEYPDEAKSSQISLKLLLREILAKNIGKLSLPSIVIGTDKRIKVEKVEVQDVEYE